MVDALERRKYFIEGVVKRFEEARVVIQLNNNETIHWPLKDFPEDIHIGEKVEIFLSSREREEEEKEEIAKALLNKILEEK